MGGLRKFVWAAIAVALTASALPAAAAATRPKSVVITAQAGAVARVTIKSFIPLDSKQSSIEILGATSGDLAGAALVGSTEWGHRVSVLPVGCRFDGNCQQVPLPNTWGPQTQGKVRGLGPGTYDFVVLGRPGARVSLRLRNALAERPLRFSKKSHVRVTEMKQLYPSQPDQMPEAYFDEQLAGPAGKNVTVLVGHLDAARPKTLQFSSCLRMGPVPVVHIPRYGKACTGEGLTSTTGGVSVGGEDCATVPPPVCFPFTNDAFHVSFTAVSVFSASPHASVTADILATKSGVRASALTFTLA